MTKTLLSALLALVLLAAPPAGASQALVLGIIPWETQDRLRNMFEPVAAHLSAVLGQEVLLVTTADYQDLAARMAQHKVDVGLFTPAAYVQAKQQIPGLRYLVTPLMGEPGAYRDSYHGVIISLKSAGYEGLSDLRGKRFAFTDRLSASGYVYPMALLRKQGMLPDTFFREVFYLKKHDKITSALASGAIDAGATWSGHLDKARSEMGDIFTVLATTAPIPNDAYVAGPHLSRETADRVQKAFLSMTPDTPSIQESIARGWPYAAFSDRGDQFYDVVREAYDLFQ